VGAAPPAGGIGGIAAMGRPAVGLVFLQAVKISHVLRISHGLEYCKKLICDLFDNPAICAKIEKIRFL